MKKTVFLLAFLFQFVIIYPIYGVVGVSNVSCSAGSGDGNDLYKETNYTVSFDWTKDQYNSLYYAICLSTTTTHHWESGSGSSDYWLTSTGGTGSSCVYENGCTGSDNGYTVVHTDFGTGISTEGTSGSEEVTINVPSSVSNGDYYIVVVVKQDIIQVTEYNNDYDGESSTSNYLLVLVTGGTRRTWDGGGIDNNWNTPDNWSDNILPTSKDTAYFDITSDKNCIINNSTTVHTIIFTYDYTGTFNIQNATLIVNGDADFSSGGLIESFDGILEFNGDGSQLFNTGSFYSPNILVNGAADVLVSTGTDIYINSLTINEGAAFTCPSYNHMHISGGFINNGIFNHNNGTVVFDSSSGSHVIDPGGNPFNNIRIGYGGSTADWTLMSSLTADTLVVEYATLELGNFTHNISVFSYGMMGTLNFNACTLKVTGDADFSGLESINAGNGLLEFAGSAAQNFFLNSLNLPSVIHTGSDTLSLNNNNLDAAAFSQSAGFLNFNGFDIHVTGDFIITNGTSSIFLGLDGVTISAGGKASFSGQNGNLLNMNPSTLWYLHVSNELTAEYASIGNCDASGFSQGIASNSVDNGGNENWVFNDAPTDISISSSDIDENEPIGTMVGTFSTTDENTGDIHIYSLVAGTGDDDNSRFTIDIDSLKTASVFDYEIKSSYNIRLRTDDGHSGTYEKVFTITINNSNDPPTDILLSNTNVNEKGSIGMVIGTFSATDNDFEDSHIYALISGTGDTDNPSFTITNESLEANIVFDYETKSSYSIRVRATDDGNGNLFCEKIFTININNVNDEPVAEDDDFFTGEDVELSIDAPGVLANDSDADGDILTAVLINNINSSKGTLNFYSEGNLVYIPAPDFFGTATFTYQSNDGTANSNVSSVTITVEADNDPPVANYDNYIINEDITLNIIEAGIDGILVNDIDIEGDPLISVIESDVTSGTLTLQDDGSFIYIPEENFTGEDNFTYRANDGISNSNIATVTITVESDNDAPTAVNDSYNIIEDAILSIDVASGVLVNDTDIENDPLTAILISSSFNGDIALNSDGSFTYTPNPNFAGSDSFTYQANDGADNSNVATVSIVIEEHNDPPTANDDSYSIDEDITLNTTESGINGVIDNDLDTEGDPLVAVIESDVTAGSLSLQDDGSFLYTPETNFSGTATFTYRANDGTSNSNIATVTITVGANNDAPSAGSDSYSVVEDNILSVNADSGILANDTDPESNPLTAILVANTVNGNLVLESDGSFTYTPNTNFAGSDSYSYQASDGIANSKVVTVTIIVEPDNDIPIANNDSYNIDEDDTLNISAPGILVNDIDVDNDPLMPIIESDITTGNLTLHDDGSFLFVPEINFSGTATFTYQLNDGTVYSNAATVTISVEEYNDAPVAVKDSYNIIEDNTLNINADSGVLANDTDIEDDYITATLITKTINGNLALESDGSFSYTPGLDFIGIDSFTYRVNDGDINSNIVTVTIVVEEDNDIPVANNDSYNIDEDDTLDISVPGVLGNDIDIEGDSLVCIIESDITTGNITFRDNGSFVFIPEENFNGTATFTYRANDGTSSSNIATVTIVVESDNDPPVAENDSYNIDEDNILNVNTASGILVNDSDVEGDPITAILTLETVNGDLAFESDGSFTYTPDPNFAGVDSFSYMVNDGIANSNKAKVFISVNNITTREPTLSEPVSNSVIDNNLRISFDLPEAALEGSVKITFNWISGSIDNNAPHIVTFMDFIQDAGVYSFTLNGSDLSDNVNVSHVSSDPNDSLVNEAIYDITLEYQDATGDSSAYTTSTNVTYSLEKFDITSANYYTGEDRLILNFNRDVDQVDDARNITLYLNNDTTSFIGIYNPWTYTINLNQVSIQLNASEASELESWPDLSSNLCVKIENNTFADASLIWNGFISYFPVNYNASGSNPALTYREYNADKDELKLIFSSEITTVDSTKTIMLSIDNGSANTLEISKPWSWRYSGGKDTIIISLSKADADILEAFSDFSMLKIAVNANTFISGNSGNLTIDYSMNQDVIYIGGIAEESHITFIGYDEATNLLVLLFDIDIVAVDSQKVIGFSTDNGNSTEMNIGTPFEWNYGMSGRDTIIIRLTDSDAERLEGFPNLDSLELNISANTFSDGTNWNKPIDYNMDFRVLYHYESPKLEIISASYFEITDIIMLVFDKTVDSGFILTSNTIGFFMDNGTSDSIILRTPWLYSFGQTQDTIFIAVENDQALAIESWADINTALALYLEANTFGSGTSSNGTIDKFHIFYVIYVDDGESPMPVTGLTASALDCSTMVVKWTLSSSSDVKEVKLCVSELSMPQDYQAVEISQTVGSNVNSAIFGTMPAYGTRIFVSAFVVDNAGNWSDFSVGASDTVILPDCIAPENIINGILTNIGDSAISVSLTLESGSISEAGIYFSINSGGPYLDTSNMIILPYHDTLFTIYNMTKQGLQYGSWAVFDSSGNLSPVKNDSVTIENSLPVLNLPQTDTIYEDSIWVITQCVSDLNNDTVTLSFINAPQDMQISQTTASLTWTPDNDDVGIHEIIVMATDNIGGTDTATIDMTVLNSNDMPKIYEINFPDTVYEDSLVNGWIKASDPDKGDTLTLGFSSEITWLNTVNVSVIDNTDSLWQFDLEGCPTDEHTGLAVFTITIKDAEGMSDIKTDTIYIVNTNDPPQIYLGKKDISIGAVRFTLICNDDFDTVLTYKAVIEGSNNNIYTNAITNHNGTFTVYPLSDGQYSFTCYCEDKEGLKDSLLDTVTISGSSKHTWADTGNWNMISVPSISYKADLFKNLGVISRWDESSELNGIYMYYLRSDAINELNAGMSYWCMSSEHVNIEINQEDFKRDSVTVQLNKSEFGWNQIASPYPYPVKWNKNYTLWQWKNEIRDFVEETDGILYPWEGYWVLADSAETVTLSPEPVFVNKALSKQAKTCFINNNEWTFGIELTTNINRDVDNLFGISKYAKNGYDALDRPEPPRMGNEPYLFFAHPEWKRPVDEFASDIRHTWEKVNIFQVGISPCSKDVIALILNITGHSTDMPIYMFLNTSSGISEYREDMTLSLDPSDKKRYFTVFITADKDFLKSYPQAFKMGCPYPNPCGHSTKIKYTLPYRLDDDGWLNHDAYSVKMFIYDVRGRVVRELINRKQDPGHYTVIWNGKSNTGRLTASGTYFLRFIAGKYSSVKKIIVLQ